jgi:U-box domain
MEPRTYPSLTGIRVRVDRHEQSFPLPKKSWDLLLKDPISHEYITDPVVFQNVIYDRTTITRWFRTSNIDPATGSPVVADTIKLIPFLALKYLLYCLEDVSGNGPDNNQEYLIYHSVITEPYLACYLAEHIPIVKHPILKLSAKAYMKKALKEYRNDNFKWNSHSFVDMSKLPVTTELARNAQYTNCIVPQWILDKFGGIVNNNLRHLTPMEILLSCSITGNIITDTVYLTPSGYMVSWSSQALPNTNSMIANTLLERLNDVKPSQGIPVNLLGNRIRECLNWDQGIVVRNVPVVYTYYYFPSDNNKDSPIPIRTPDHRIYERLVEIRKMILVDPSYVTAIAKLSTLATVDNIKMGCGQGGNCPLTIQRRQLGIPFVIDQSSNIYGLDLSLLDLSGRTFTNISFKDYHFVGTNCKGTRFVKCGFMICPFIGANLEGAIFEECSFTESPAFLGATKDDKTDLIHCTGDQMSIPLLSEFFLE